MQSFLLTWNPTKSNWIGQEDQIQFELGFDVFVNWSCGSRRNLPVGSQVFMMCLGYRQPIHGIFASGITTSEPFSDEHWNENAESSTAHYVEFRLDTTLNPDVHTLFNPESEISNAFNWRPQTSGIQIPESIASELNDKWLHHLEKLNAVTNFRNSDTNTINTKQVYVEGKRSQVTVNRYERDPHARQLCIEHYGLSCAVCNFNFESEYGQLGAGYIHVHHLNPISMQKEQYELNPIKDLRPVCPNCHAMLHRQSPPLTIEELKDLMKYQKD